VIALRLDLMIACIGLFGMWSYYDERAAETDFDQLAWESDHEEDAENDEDIWHTVFGDERR
jgi:hypothetical protein